MRRPVPRRHLVPRPARDVSLTVLCEDVLHFDLQETFDIVFDSGCLHNVSGRELRAYKRQLLKWLAPNGELVLAHWGKRHLLDWRPIGPRRRTQACIERLLAPELELMAATSTDEAVSLPFGPRVRMATFRYRRTDAAPQEL